MDTSKMRLCATFDHDGQVWRQIDGFQPNEPFYEKDDKRFCAPIPPAPAARNFLGHDLPNYHLHNMALSIPTPVMTLEERLELSAAAPGVAFAVRTGAHTKSHNVSHALRQFAYLRALDYLVTNIARGGNANGLIVDIGGNATMTRYHPAAMSIHHTQPILDARDAARGFEPINSCRCAFPKSCNHCSDPMGYLSVHSLYYLDPADILSAVQTTPFVAVVHRFNGFVGDINGMHWERRGRDVIMGDGVDTRLYKHLACDWSGTPTTILSAASA